MIPEQIFFTMLFSLVIIIEINDTATLFDAVKPKTCDAPLCADPPPGCVTHPVKDEFNCPVTCVYSCGAPWCPPLTCIAHCPGDYVRDRMGCNTCECKPPCEQRRCWLNCPFGYLRDKAGCRTCACAFINTLPPYIVAMSMPTQEQKPTTERGNVSTLDPTTAADSSQSTTTTTAKSMYCILTSSPSTNITSL